MAKSSARVAPLPRPPQRWPVLGDAPHPPYPRGLGMVAEGCLGRGNAVSWGWLVEA